MQDCTPKQAIWTSCTLNSLPSNRNSHLFKSTQSIGRNLFWFSPGAFASSSLTSCTSPSHDAFLLFRRHSRSQIPPYAACANIRFTQSQLHPLPLRNTSNLRRLKNPRTMGSTRPSTQSSPGCIGSSSTPSKLPRAYTIPGHGVLRVNCWDLQVMVQSTWYALSRLLMDCCLTSSS